MKRFPELSASGTYALGNANQWGDFCGTGMYSPPRGKSTRRPICVLGNELDYTSVGDWARAVNVRGDLYLSGASSAPSGAALYWDSFGAFNLNDLVVGTPEDVQTWKNAGFYKVNDINDPLDPFNKNSFGEVVGLLRRADGSYVSFYLTPVP